MSPEGHQRKKEGGECFAPLYRYFLLRSCAPKRVEMMPGKPQVNTKIGKSSILRPLVNDYFELVLQVLPSTLKFDTTPVKLTAPTKMPNNLVCTCPGIWKQILRLRWREHKFVMNLEFEPRGRPEEQQTEKIASHHFHVNLDNW